MLTVSGRRVLEELRERDMQERRDGVRRPESLMAVAAPVAELLYLLVLQSRARTIVEFGTSHGYATIHLAAAAERTGGHVFTVDVLADKTARATENLRAADLAHRVTLTTADGAGFVRGLPERVDFVLVDYDVTAFLPAFKELRTRMAERAVMFVDGGPSGHWETGGGRALKSLLDEDPDFIVSVLPMHKEQLVAIRIPPAAPG